MNKTEMKRLLAVMEFFYGFLFGVAIFGATLTFLLVQTFFVAILFAVCVCAFFLFLMVIVRYCIVRIKLAHQTFEIELESRILQEQVLKSLKCQEDLIANITANTKE